MRIPRRGVQLRLSWLAPLLCLGYALLLLLQWGDAYAWVTVGAKYAPPELLPYVYSDEGYDGQSVYYIARYGWQSVPYLDVPAYRFQRILLPVMGGLLAVGQVAILPYTLLLVNLLALAGGTWLLEKLLRDYRVSWWFAAGYALSAGVWGATRLTTTEPLAYGLVIAGIVLANREKWGWSAALFALAALAKEMTLIFPAVYVLHLVFSVRGKPFLTRLTQAGLFGLIAIVPFGLWQAVLYQQLGAFGVGSGGEGATSFEIIPFMGFIRILTEGGANAFALLAPLNLLFVVLPTLWGAWCCGRDLQRYWATRHIPAEHRPRTWTIETSLLGINVLLMFFVPFSTYRELLGILRFIVGLQIAVILYGASRRHQRVLMYSTLWFMTSFIVILSDFAAA